MALKGKTTEQRLAQAHFKIMQNPDWCAFAGVALMGESLIVDTPLVPTACVNAAGNRFYNRKFMDPLNDSEFVYIVLHETLHFALSHLTVWKGLFKQDARLAGIAADHVVNNMIDETEEGAQRPFATMPKDKSTGKPIGYADRKYRGWSVLDVFKDLQKNPPLDGSGGQMDTHDLTAGEGEGGRELTEEESKLLQDAIDQALRQGAYLAGKLGGKNNRRLGELLTPKVDWKAELMDFVVASCAGEQDATWKKPMRRFVGMDTYFPSFEDTSIGELVIAIDVSGSCWSYTERFMSEVVSISKTVRPSKLRLIQWDVGVTAETIYLPDEVEGAARTFEAVGGGGTTVAPVADYVHSLEDVQCAIILTDGDIFGSWEGEQGWGCPTLWALTSNRHLAPCGKTLRLDAGDFL